MKPLPTTHRTLLLTILADIDALWTPWRFSEAVRWASAAVMERRQTFASHGIPIIVGGSDSMRQRGSRELRALVSSGLIRLVGRGKTRGVLLTEYGDNYARSLTPTKRIDEAWPHLERVAATEARFNGESDSRFVLEFDVVGIRSEKPETYTKKLLKFEDEALPLLANSLLDCWGDAEGRIGYRTTDAGKAALAAGKPKPPADMPVYDPEAGQEFIDAYSEALASRPKLDIHFVAFPRRHTAKRRHVAGSQTHHQPGRRNGQHHQRKEIEMSTTTTSTKATRRTLNGISNQPTYKVSKAVQGKLDAVNDKAHELAERIEEWRADKDQLYLTAGGMIVDEAPERNAELERERAAISDAYIALAWEEFAIRALLLEFAQAAAKEAAAKADRAVADTLTGYAAMGVDVHAIEGGEFNPEAANHRLRQRALQEIPVMAATSAANRAEADVTVLKSRIGTPVSPDACRLTWTPPAGVAAHVLRLLGA